MAGLLPSIDGFDHGDIGLPQQRARDGRAPQHAFGKQIRTTGFPIDISRSYDSTRAVDGPFGIGWTSSISARLVYAAYMYAAPATYRYEADVVMPHGTIYRFTRETSGAFTPPVGRRDALVMNGDGTFTLTLQDSRSKYKFNADGSLAAMTDEFGNALLYTYDANGKLQRGSSENGLERGQVFEVRKKALRPETVAMWERPGTGTAWNGNGTGPGLRISREWPCGFRASFSNFARRRFVLKQGPRVRTRQFFVVVELRR